MVEKLFLDPLSFIQYVFIVCQGKSYQNILKLSYQPIAFTSYNLKEKKRGLELVSLPHFLHKFFKKNILLYSIHGPNFIVRLSLLQ